VGNKVINSADIDGMQGENEETTGEKQVNHSLKTTKNILGRITTTLSYVNIKLLHNIEYGTYTMTKDFVSKSTSSHEDGSVSSFETTTNLYTQKYHVNPNFFKDSSVESLEDMIRDVTSLRSSLSLLTKATSSYASGLTSQFSVNNWTNYRGVTRTWYGINQMRFLGNHPPREFQTGTRLRQFAKGMRYTGFALAGLSLGLSFNDYINDAPKMGVGFGGNKNTELILDIGFTGLSLSPTPAAPLSYFYFTKYKAVAKAETFKERYNARTANTYDPRAGNATLESRRKQISMRNEQIKNYLKTIFNDL